MHHLHSIEAESEVIATIIGQPEKAIGIANKVGLEITWFLDPWCQFWYRGIESLISAGQEITEKTLLIQAVQLPNPPDHNPEEIKGRLAALTQASVGTSAHLEFYLGVLRDYLQKRGLRDLSQRITQEVTTKISAEDILSQVREEIAALQQLKRSTRSIDDVVSSIKSKYRESAKLGYMGLPSRWPMLQQVLGGYNKRNVTVVAGPTKHGKTTLCSNEILSWGYAEKPIGVISMEMSEEQVRAKFAADTLDIDLFKLKQGLLPQATARAFEAMLDDQKSLPIRIYEKSKTIQQIVNIIRDHAGEWESVCIDHLQMILKRGQMGDTEHITRASNEITNAIKDADMHCFLISQLNRDALVDMHGKMREPEPRHLRQSGAIEQDLSQLLFVFQDITIGTSDLLPDNAPTTLKIALNREGPTGKVQMVFKKSCQKLVPSREDTPF